MGICEPSLRCLLSPAPDGGLVSDYSSKEKSSTSKARHDRPARGSSHLPYAACGKSEHLSMRKRTGQHLLVCPKSDSHVEWPEVVRTATTAIELALLIDTAEDMDSAHRAGESARQFERLRLTRRGGVEWVKICSKIKTRISDAHEPPKLEVETTYRCAPSNAPQ